MANPVFVTCPKDAWTEVATKVSTGFIHRKISTAYYLCTYRENGDPAPTDNGEEGVPIFLQGVTEAISADTDIDVYIYAQTTDGEVRVDLPSA